MADPNPAALRPLTVPSLSPDLSNLQQLRVQLAQAKDKIHSYRHLDHKLATFTDEPTWNAYIPVGPLAYFPGQLIHTNDITRVDNPPQADAADQDPQPRRVLRSAKQARGDVAQAVKDLEAQVVTLTREIEAAEADLRKKRDDERKLGKGAASAGTADLGDEDWTINAQGEVINEEGLPMFDIREDLPLEPAPVASSSKAAQAAPANSSARARGYLIKKGGKQIVRPLPPPIHSAPPAPSSSSSSAPTQPSSTAHPSYAPAPVPAPAETDPNPFPARQPLDIKAILDELEAEEAAAAAVAAAASPPAVTEAEHDEPAPSAERKIVELPDSPPPAAPVAPVAPSSSASKPAAPSTSSAGGFAGFSAGFLAKSKQKRPSNSLAAAGPTSSTSSPSSGTSPATSSTPATTTSASTPAAAASAPAPAPAPAPVPALKPALSRPVSPSARSRAATPAGDKKRVAFDLPPPSAAEEQPSAKKAPILLGPPPSSSAATPASAPAEPRRVEAPAQRPIRDVVVERPLRKAVAPGGGAGASAGAGAGGLPVREKRLSRFKREAFGEPAASVEDVVEGKGKGRAVDERESAPSAASSSPSHAPAARSAEPPSAPISSDVMPAPVHTISLSARPSSGADRPPGTVSFGDIPFGSDEEDEGVPHVAGDVDGEEDEDDDDWDYSDDDDFDDDELDVDLALHQREVALAYHRQRLMLGAGRGTGPLGGWHAEGENPFGAAADEEADQALVPADATLQSLDPSLAASTFGTYPSAGAAQEGRPSRFRQSNRNLESAQLIIPSLLAADPSLAMSHTPLGPPLEHDGEPAAGADADDEDERLRRTLEALAEGRPLPEDEQAAEREREIALREELARDKASAHARRDRTAGKRPPEVVQTIVPERKAPVEIEVRDEAQPAAEVQQEEEKPKKLSRFRQKQLGLIE
ncbi:hypothetical protein JCM3775_002630 [Rhodotorula graminis]